MIGFLFRKTFYDLWDNMFRIVIVNLGFIAIVSIPVFIPPLVARFIDSVALSIVISAIGILLCSVYLSTAALTLKSISDYGSFGFADFFGNVKAAWPAGLVMGFFVFVLFIVLTVVLPFYISIDSPFGLVLAAIVFWTVIFAMLSFQYYFTVYARLSSKLTKAFKKCFIISLDNSGFSVFVLLSNFVSLVLSVVFAFMFPGPAGILLYLDEALRLRLLKYDYLEENPGANRRKIPWDALLIEERERVGTRTFRNFIFPWKD
jgi:hypothetical protein